VYELAARDERGSLCPKEVPVAGWGAFEDGVSRVLDTVASRRATTKVYVSDALFRGQADERWPLATTLERFSTTRESA